jgi:uncharacterized phage protein (TIGR01671 family)
MREILFRGKTKEGIWIYGYPLWNKEGCMIYKINKPNNVPFISNFDFIDSETLSQFVDLTDKNNNKVYEGDIVKNPNATEPEDLGWEVYWNDAVAGFEFLCMRKSIDGSRSSWMPNFDAVAGEFEVIGNIYEPKQGGR